MRSGTRGPESQASTSGAVRLLGESGRIALFLIVAVASMLAVFWYFSPEQQRVAAVSELAVSDSGFIRDPQARLAPITKPKPSQPVQQRLAQSPPPVKIGIIAGHRGNDSGTECEDGLTEVQITTALAERIAAKLKSEGINVETLDEFDIKLDGYTATALVSIHVDSCDYVNDSATGFKISGSPFIDSSALSICMEYSYTEATQLPYHPSSITPHMADYHAFRAINPGTPALIIEVGFLNLDREILTTGSERVVEGLTGGIRCYLDKTR